MVKLHLGPLAWEIPSWRKVLKRFEDFRAYFGTSKALWKFRTWGCNLSDSLSSPQGVSPGVTLEKYEKEQRFVASSAANMLAIMEKSVEPGVIIKQPEPLALWSNLFWNLMKEADRISEYKALLYPAMSLRILSQQGYEAVRGRGSILFAELLGPVGSPMKHMRSYAWKVRPTESEGLEPFSFGCIEHGSPAAVHDGWCTFRSGQTLILTLRTSQKGKESIQARRVSGITSHFKFAGRGCADACSFDDHYMAFRQNAKTN